MLHFHCLTTAQFLSCILREALAGEGEQSRFSYAFGGTAVQPPPAQPQYPRMELQLESRCSPQPHTLRSAFPEGTIRQFIDFCLSTV